jgi:broad specificity phosphatase PhoE
MWSLPPAMVPRVGPGRAGDLAHNIQMNSTGIRPSGAVEATVRDACPADRREVPILLARHGETADNANRLILGRRDPPLSAAGWEQAEALAARARRSGVATVWASPLTRARQTASIVATALGCDAVILNDLIESDRGTWEGQSVAKLALASPQLHAAFERGDPGFAFPEGESLLDQVQRTRRALTRVAAGAAPALVVAHAGTIRAALLAMNRQLPAERELAHGEIVELMWSAAEAGDAGPG